MRWSRSEGSQSGLLPGREVASPNVSTLKGLGDHLVQIPHFQIRKPRPREVNNLLNSRASRRGQYGGMVRSAPWEADANMELDPQEPHWVGRRGWLFKMKGSSVWADLHAGLTQEEGAMEPQRAVQGP